MEVLNVDETSSNFPKLQIPNNTKDCSEGIDTNFDSLALLEQFEKYEEQRQCEDDFKQLRDEMLADLEEFEKSFQFS